MNRLSSRNNRLKFKTSGNLPITVEEKLEYTSNECKQNRKLWTGFRLELESEGSWPSVPQTSWHYCTASDTTVLYSGNTSCCCKSVKLVGRDSGRKFWFDVSLETIAQNLSPCEVEPIFGPGLPPRRCFSKKYAVVPDYDAGEKGASIIV